MPLVNTGTDRKRDLLSEIVIWLYTHDRAFGSSVEWRKAFIEFLEETI